MRYVYSLILPVCIALGMTASAWAEEPDASEEPVRIVTTIFPAYDWAREILGENAENAELTLLADNGVDLHSYSPSVDDILKISGSDIFIYVGGESDAWAADAFREASAVSDVKAVCLMDAVEDAAGTALREEEIVEGMEDGHDHEHEDGDHDDADAGHETEYDEHVWLSLKNAVSCVDAIAEAISGADPAGAEMYKENAASYDEKLIALDEKYRASVLEGTLDTVLFGDRFPFRYLMDDYGIHYYAAFAGCSAETEASFDTIIFLAEKVKELGLHTILVIEGDSLSIAQTVIDAAGAGELNIGVMDSLQAVTAGEIEEGITYLSAMEKNLEVLSAALQ